jgi:hypothetical protein
MIGRDPTHDAAVSFLAADDAPAIELAPVVAGGMTTFVYSERQAELVGRDGMSELNRVFKYDSRRRHFEHDTQAHVDHVAARTAGRDHARRGDHAQ